MNTITRIAAPKFKVGKFTLNEYELRQFQNEVLERQRPGNVWVKEVLTGKSYRIDEKGVFQPHAPAGYGVTSGLTLQSIRVRRLYNTVIDNSKFSVRLCSVAEFHNFTIVEELYDFALNLRVNEMIKFGKHSSQCVRNGLILRELADFGLTI